MIHGYVACVENDFSGEIPILCDDLIGVQDNDRYCFYYNKSGKNKNNIHRLILQCFFLLLFSNFVIFL